MNKRYYMCLLTLMKWTFQIILLIKSLFTIRAIIRVHKIIHLLCMLKHMILFCVIIKWWFGTCNKFVNLAGSFFIILCCLTDVFDGRTNIQHKSRTLGRELCLQIFATNPNINCIFLRLVILYINGNILCVWLI